MLDKNLIKKNFEKSLKTYPQNASVQQKAAEKLASLIKAEKYPKILEVGSYTGFFTRLITQKVDFEYYLALDIVDSFDFIKHLSPKIDFKISDIEKIELNQKFDLIAASSSLQWCDDFSKTAQKLKNLLNERGTLALCLYGRKNLQEIKEAFGLGLNYKSKQEFMELFPNSQIFEDMVELHFQNPLEILRHLKLTGVNSLSNNLSVSNIKQGLKKLQNSGNKLTYNPIYIIFSKN